MALTCLLDLQIAVPEPTELLEFWQRRGLTLTGPQALGTPERPSQLRIHEAPFRHVSEVGVACSSESDLVEIADRLERLGLDATITDGSLRVADPILDHVMRIDVTAAPTLSPTEPQPHNAPGSNARPDGRAPASVGATDHAPRRIGHVVFGTPDVEASRAFFVDGLGFRVSDVAGDGIAYFLRCSADHHNVLLAPAPVPCLNHYAIEMDDVDAIGLAANDILGERPDCSVAGLGRHIVGSNLFWYLLDPAGGLFELFSDMDMIEDDERWEREVRRDDWDPFGIAAWNAGAPTPDFFLPSDLDEIAQRRELARR
jgi:catechol 2,3-dioxygenase-like lactoylglutathione lyase family enzyme